MYNADRYFILTAFSFVTDEQHTNDRVAALLQMNDR